MTLQQQFTQPEIGTQVEVVVNNKWYGGKLFYHRPDTASFVGTVLTPPSHIGPDAFALSGPQHFMTRVFALDDVVNLRALDGAEIKKRNINVEDVIEKSVQGSKDNIYTVKKQGKLWSCTCKGFMFRKDCKHIHIVKENKSN